MKPRKRPTILVSSTVYGIEELLEQVYSYLTGCGYEVWCSHKGTVPVDPGKTALENCMEAVDKCDLFLGIITPHYGSGKIGHDLSITHQELLRAIQLGKPRWILAHDHVPFARSLFLKFRCKTAKQRAKFLKALGYDTDRKLANFAKREQNVIDDLRVIDMYDAAIRHDLRVYQDRKGNWVQKFVSEDDAMLFTVAQFYRQAQVEQFLKDNLADTSAILKRAKERGIS